MEAVSIDFICWSYWLLIAQRITEMTFEQAVNSLFTILHRTGLLCWQWCLWIIMSNRLKSGYNKSPETMYGILLASSITKFQLKRRRAAPPPNVVTGYYCTLPVSCLLSLAFLSSVNLQQQSVNITQPAKYKHKQTSLVEAVRQHL